MHPHVQMRTATIVKEDGVTMVLLHGSPCRRREDWVGSPSESGIPEAEAITFVMTSRSSRCSRVYFCWQKVYALYIVWERKEP